ncbi:MAG: hypothetical protein A2167_04725 [Planctomycetes bacterium RBG_13_46_10]|nr:MAG: hypothetical protein A2167_04725 [Planctomycetes bacterium RBG_13_46_10]
MKTRKTATILCTAIVLVLPCLAKATPVGTVDIVHDGYGASDVLTIYGGGHSGLNGYGGVYMLDKTAGTGQGNIWSNGPIGGFCIELHQWSPDTTTKYDVVALQEVNNSFMGGVMGAAKADYLAELWGRFYNPAWADGGPYSGEEKGMAEAFAAAVWEIIYEDMPASPLNWDVTVDGSAGSHGFYAQNVNSALANSWLNILDGTGPKAQLMAFVNEGKQDFLVQVPEPATVCLLGLGWLVFLRKRRTA